MDEERKEFEDMPGEELTSQGMEGEAGAEPAPSEPTPGEGMEGEAGVEPTLPQAEPAQPLPPPTVAGLTQDDRTLAALAHASMLLNLVTGFGGLIAAVVIWLAYRDRSKYVEDQALQATVFQGLWLVSGAVVAMMWVAVGLLSAIIIGICLIPFAILISLVPIVAFFYPFYAAIEVYQGRDFKYLWLGDLVRGRR
jgi:uncharacterized Tic20 family protein